MLSIANSKWRDIIKNTEPYIIDTDKGKAIDKFVYKAEKILKK